MLILRGEQGAHMAAAGWRQPTTFSSMLMRRFFYECPIKAPMTPNRQQERLVMEAGDMARAMSRIAHEILERNKGVKDLGLVGIRTGGVHLAHRLVRRIQDIEGVAVPIGELDITLYRDDLSLRKEQPVLRKTSVPFDISGKIIVLVDDVLFTGRTIRAAMDGLIDLGRPAEIQLAVMVDRGHRQLPIKATYIGKNIPTSRDENIQVMLEEAGEDDRVVILKGVKEMER
jgi:pyrimidine operon attenuation protein/uracil phosphoribosyltransferase